MGNFPDAEENGRIWAIVSETLFSFTFDRERKTFRVQEIASYDKTAYNTKSNKGWISRPIDFDRENNRIYAVFDANSGM